MIEEIGYTNANLKQFYKQHKGTFYYASHHSLFPMQ